MCRFPDTYEESAFDANWSGSPERSVRKWKYPHRGIHIKTVLTVTLYCPGIVFLNIKKKVQKKIGTLIMLKCFVPVFDTKRMQFVDNAS